MQTDGRWSVEQFRNFTGGENRQVLPELLAPNELAIARNCIFTSDGALESRKGKVKINTVALPAAIRGLWRWSTANGTAYITCVAANKVYHAVWDGSSTMTFGASVKTLSSSSNKIRGKVWKDVLILSDGVSPPFRVAYNGVCTDLGGTPPKFNIFTVHASKLAVIDYNNPSQLRFSGLEDYDTWNALDVYNVFSNDGTQCTALDSQDAGLAIHKTNSIWALYGFDRYDFQLSTAPISPVGAVSQDMVMPGVFMGQDNFYTCSLPNVTPLKNTHGTLLSAMTATERSDSVGCFATSSRLAVMAIGQDIFCLNGLFGGAVTTWDNLDVTSMAYAQDTGEMLVGSSDGVIYRLAGADDNGIPFTTDIRTAYLDMGSVKEKNFRNVTHSVNVNSGGYDMLVNASTDFGMMDYLNQVTVDYSNPLTWDVDSWDMAEWAVGSGTRNTGVHWLHAARGHYVAVGFKTASQVKFMGFTVKFREVGNLI